MVVNTMPFQDMPEKEDPLVFWCHSQDNGFVLCEKKMNEVGDIQDALNKTADTQRSEAFS